MGIPLPAGLAPLARVYRWQEWRDCRQGVRLMTKRQSEALAFIQQFIEQNGYSPSLREIAGGLGKRLGSATRSEEHTSELQSLMRISYAVFCLKKKTEQHISSYLSAH